MIRLETSRKNYLRGVAVDRKIIEWLVPRFAKLALAKIRGYSVGYRCRSSNSFVAGLSKIPWCRRNAVRARRPTTPGKSSVSNTPALLSVTYLVEAIQLRNPECATRLLSAVIERVSTAICGMRSPCAAKNLAHVFERSGVAWWYCSSLGERVSKRGVWLIAHLFLEPLHCPAQRGLGDVQGFCRAPEAAIRDDGRESLKQLEVVGHAER